MSVSAHERPGGHDTPQPPAGTGRKHVGGAQTQPDGCPARSKNVHVSSGGQKPPHTGPPPGTPLKQGVLATGMHAQSSPPDTHACPAGHAPSHAAPRMPSHGCVPDTH